MKKNRSKDEQIIHILKKHEVSVFVSDLARRHRFSEDTLYTWKSKFGGMEV